MSQDMSTFFTGVRRYQPKRVPRTRPVIRSGAAAARTAGTAPAATRNRRPQVGAGVGAGPTAGAELNRRRPMATRLTGGGGGGGGSGPGPSTSPPMRRQPTGTTPTWGAAPRRFREIEWIMKPSKNFMQCSKSSSENSFPDGASDMEKSWPRRSSGDSWSSGSSGSSGCSGDSESSSSRERMEYVPPKQHLVDLLKSSFRAGEPMRPGSQARMQPKKRTSRVFCVPDQRILHAEELLQAQMLQMRPRNMKSPHFPAPPQSKSSNRPLPSQKPSENVLLYATSTAILVQPENPYMDTPTGLISCSPSPTTSAKPSQDEIQPPCTSLARSSASASPSPSSSSTPSQISMPKPTTASKSSDSSSLSTSGTECSVERMVQRYRGTAGGSKAIKLTSTVIKIMPNKARTSQRSSKGKVRQQSRVKLRSRTTSQFLQNGSRDPAISQALNAPMTTRMPMVKVSKPMVNQSVHQVVNQLTAQLKEAVGEDCQQPAKRDLEMAAGKQWAHGKLGRKTSIYMLMDQAKPDQARARYEPSPSTNDDWVIQPMEQQVISAAMEQPSQKDHRNLSGSEQLNPFMSDSKVAVGHNCDVHIDTPRDRGQSKSQAQPKMNPSQSPPGNSQLSLEPEARNSVQNRTTRQPKACHLLPPAERSLRSLFRSLTSQPVSLNRIPERTRLPAVTTLQQQPKPAEPQSEVVTGAAGKIVRKAQHKVPKTMEDGIDMSYQYFVSLPLKRGRKPQAVRYLYRPMVRNLNGLPATGRRSSKRAKRRRAAAKAVAVASIEAQEPEQQPQQGVRELDPDLVALGGAPLPLEDPPIVDEGTTEMKRSRTLIFDPEATLNSPYNVPPLKLKSRYMPMLKELGQMPYPDERLNRRRRFHRRARAAGGSELMPPPDLDAQSLPGIGGGDVVAEDIKKQSTPVIVWSGRPAPPVPRITVVDYKKEPTRLCTATGAPMMYHQPLFLTLKDVKSKPMIQTFTYESIEHEEQEREQLQLEKGQLEQKLEREQLALRLEKEQLEQELKRVQLQREQLAKEKLEIMQQEHENEKSMETGRDTAGMAKSVSFYPEPFFASRGSTSVLQTTTSSSSSILESKGKSKKRQGKKSHAKGKGKGRK